MIRATVALAGATGFLGRRILMQLVSGGYGIRILVRRPPDTLDLSGRGISHVQGDLSDADALAALVRGTDVVINAAGLIKAHNRGAFFEVNEAGARRVAQAADGRRLIHVSSLAARGPQLSDYAASKRAGERAVHDVAGSAVIVRPPMIYGPGDRETLVLFRAARGPVIAIPAKSDARLAIAHVDDVAAAIVDLGASPADLAIATIGGDRPNGYSWPQIVAAASKAVAGNPRILPIPGWLLEMTGAVSEFVGSRRAAPPIFTRGKAREAMHADWSVSPAEEGLTAGRSYIPLHEGFAQTADWYRENGWLR